MGVEGAERACHELLVALCGRLPDALLWRLRDWLAASPTPDTVSLLLPRELMRHGVGLTEHERDLLSEAAGGWGTARRLLDAVLPTHAPAGEPPAFTADPAATDTAALSLLAVVRSHPGCTELTLARHADGQRVVLVRGGERPWRLAATLQRILRAHGDRTPSVTVLTGEPSDYHRTAIEAGSTVWRDEPAEAA